MISLASSAWAGYDRSDLYIDESHRTDDLHAALPGRYPMGYAGFIPGVTTYAMTGHHPGVLTPDGENVFNIYGHAPATSPTGDPTWVAGLGDENGRGSLDQVEYGWSTVMDPASPFSGYLDNLPSSLFAGYTNWADYTRDHLIFGPPSPPSAHGSFPSVNFPRETSGQHVGPGYESSLGPEGCTLVQYCWKTAAPPFLLYGTGANGVGGASGLGSDPQTGYDFIDPANDTLGTYAAFPYSDVDSLGYEPSQKDDPRSPGVFNTVLEPYERIHTQNFLKQDDVKFIDDTFTYVPWTEGPGLTMNQVTWSPSRMPILDTLPTPSTFTATPIYDPPATYERTYFVDILRAWDHTQDTNVVRDFGCDPDTALDPKDCLIAAPDGKTDEKFELSETREIDFKFFTSSHSLEQNWGMFDITVHDEGLANHILTDTTTGRTDGDGNPLYWYEDYVHYTVDQHHEQKMEDWGTFESGMNFDVISAMKYAVAHDKSPIYPEIDPNRRIVDYYTPIALVHNEWGGHGDITSNLYVPNATMHDP